MPERGRAGGGRKQREVRPSGQEAASCAGPFPGWRPPSATAVTQGRCVADEDRRRRGGPSDPWNAGPGACSLRKASEPSPPARAPLRLSPCTRPDVRF